MRLLLDGHISAEVARGLREAGRDVVSLIETRLRMAPDEVVWRRAIADGRALVTYSASDSLALVAQTASSGKAHSGLVVVSTKTIPTGNIGGLIRALDLLISAADVADDRVIYLRNTG